MSEDRIVDRIERQLGIPGLARRLADETTAPDLQSLLLAVYRRRAAALPPKRVLAAWERNRFVRPSAVEPAKYRQFESAAAPHLAAEGFTEIELSPLAPLATVATVAPVDPVRSVATVRNTEVVSDPTNVLALECAVRRRAPARAGRKNLPPVRLAAHHRTVRPEATEGALRFAHFRIFVLVTATRATSGFGAEIDAAREHLRVLLRAARDYLDGAAPLRVVVSDLGDEGLRPALAAGLLAPFAGDLADVERVWETDRERGRGYYSPFRFGIYAAGARGAWVELADGGPVDWTRRLLSDRKERLVISGLGTERLCSLIPVPRGPGGPTRA